MRTTLAVVATLAVAALGGAILGEYTLANAVAVLACVLFGVVVGEAAVAIQRRPLPATVVAAGVSTPVAWVWSLWISTGHQLGYVSVAQWVAVPFAGASAALWVVTARRL